MWKIHHIRGDITCEEFKVERNDKCVILAVKFPEFKPVNKRGHLWGGEAIQVFRVYI